MIEWSAGMSLGLALIVAAVLEARDRYKAGRLSRTHARRLASARRRAPVPAAVARPADARQRRAA